MADYFNVEGFEGMWSGGFGTTTSYDVGDVNIVVATSSDIESVQKIAAQINAATATGILTETGATSGGTSSSSQFGGPLQTGTGIVDTGKGVVSGTGRVVH